MLCICALYRKRQQIKFFEKIFEPLRALPHAFFILMQPWLDFLFWKSQFVQKSVYQDNRSRSWSLFPGQNWKDICLLRILHSWFYYTSESWKSVDAERREADKLKIAFAIFLTLSDWTPAASGLTHLQTHGVVLEVISRLQKWRPFLC